jgi:outer membrane murein-binding lipoprotein Lpp
MPPSSGYRMLAMGRRSIRALVLAVAVAVGAFALTACGNSKPDYCSDRSNLSASVDTLKNDVSGGADFSTLQSDIAKVQTDAEAVVSSAKDDFPSETKGLNSSVADLKSSIDALPPSPSAQDLRGLLPQAAAVIAAVNRFTSATDSKCD